MDALQSQVGINVTDLFSNVSKGVVGLRAKSEPAVQESELKQLLTDYGYALRSMEVAKAEDWFKLKTQYTN